MKFFPQRRLINHLAYHRIHNIHKRITNNLCTHILPRKQMILPHLPHPPSIPILPLRHSPLALSKIEKRSLVLRPRLLLAGVQAKHHVRVPKRARLEHVTHVGKGVAKDRTPVVAGGLGVAEAVTGEVGVEDGATGCDGTVEEEFTEVGDEDLHCLRGLV